MFASMNRCIRHTLYRRMDTKNTQLACAMLHASRSVGRLSAMALPSSFWRTNNTRLNIEIQIPERTRNKTEIPETKNTRCTTEGHTSTNFPFVCVDVWAVSAFGLCPPRPIVADNTHSNKMISGNNNHRVFYSILLHFGQIDLVWRLKMVGFGLCSERAPNTEESTKEKWQPVQHGHRRY